MRPKINEDLIKAEKRLYFKNWRKNNREKVKEHNARYWEKRVEKKMLQKS